MNIGKAAAAGGVSAKMIRYYERIGLLGRSKRSASGYRVFDDADVHTLRFIRQARELGFSMKEIRTLLDLWQDRTRSSREVRQLVAKHLETVDRRIGELEDIRGALAHLVRHCRGDDRPECPILEGLSRSIPSPVRGGGST